MKRHRYIVGIVIHLSLAQFCYSADGFSLYLDLRGVRVEGKLLGREGDRVHLLGRDGRRWSFKTSEATNFGISEGRFRSMSQAEMRSQLRREFRNGYTVTGTGHFLVVHPTGTPDVWSKRFEDLYRNFVHYFSVRGMRPRPLEFPLVAVVFRSQGEFLRHAATQGVNLSDGVLGYYSPESNRIEMFVRPQQEEQASWQSTATTIIHEAAHQSAFNAGIHNRFAKQPHWLVEGLGTMFEAPGVNDSRSHPRRTDRINQAQLQLFHRSLPEQSPQKMLLSLVSADQLFQTAPAHAYAYAWALCFYLAETQPQKFFAYMTKVAERKPFSSYSAVERLTDFTDSFGSDFRMLDARMREFMEQLSR